MSEVTNLFSYDNSRVINKEVLEEKVSTYKLSTTTQLMKAYACKYYLPQ